MTCSKCRGSGIHRVKLRLRGYMNFPCPQCDKVGSIFCSGCYGLESTTENEMLTAKERTALRELFSRVKKKSTLVLPLDRAIDEVESVLLNVESGLSLSYFRSIKPKYTYSRPLRNQLQAVPPGPENLKHFPAGRCFRAWFNV